MKKLTSFTNLTTAEGERIAYTYSVLDADGNIISQNNKESYVVGDKRTLDLLLQIRGIIQERLDNE